MSTHDDSSSRRSDENRVPLAEAKATLTIGGKQIDASVLNISNDGISFWLPENPGLTVGATPRVELGGESFVFSVKWIDDATDRGFVIGGDRADTAN
ncbi:MAG: hypothetical protein KDB27_17710 [Planctomycetales bacterium]|nr:hypothetical protein [Planctomycetales bacterium]